MGKEFKVGNIALDLVINQGAFNKALNGIKGLAVKAGAAVAAAFSVAKLVDFGKKCIDLGSDLVEVQNVVDVTFGSMSDKINSWASNAMTAYGLSETVVKRYTGTFGAMAKSFDFTTDQAITMSETLTALSADVASFYNLSTDEAYAKIKSVFTGETESLKELGVVMTQTALDSYALANGFGKTTAKMSEQEKVALRYAFVQDKLAAASGDFARTSDGWANQTRVLSLRFDQLKASIGQGLINVLTPAIQALNALLAKLQLAANAFKEFTTLIFGDAGESSGGAAISAAAEAAAGMESATDGTANGMSEAAKSAEKLKRSLMGFDEINTLTDNSDDSDSSSGAVGVGTVTGISDADASNSAISLAPDLLDKLQSKINQFDFSGLTRKFKTFGDSLLQQIRQYDWLGALGGLGDGLLGLFVSLANMTAGAILPIISALNIPGVVYGAIELLTSGLIALKNAVDAVSPAIQAFVDTALVPIADWVGKKIIDALDFWSTKLDEIGDWFTAHTSDFTEFSSAVSDIAGRIWKLLEPIADSAWSAWKDILSALGDKFSGVAESALNFISKIADGWDKLVAFYDELGAFKFLAEEFEAAFSLIGSIVESVGDAIAGVFEGLLTQFGGAFEF